MPSKDFEILKANLITEKNKILGTTLLEKAKNICLKIKKRKLAKLELIKNGLKISSSDCKENEEKYNSPEKKLYTNYNEINNYHKYRRNKPIISIENYRGKNLMDLFDKINVNEEKSNNNNKKFPTIENKIKIKKNLLYNHKHNHNLNNLKLANIL